MRIDSAQPVRIQPFQPAVHHERSAPAGASPTALPTAVGSPKESDEASHERSGDHEPTDEQRREIEELRSRDREVKAHEQAHKAAGGPHAGPPSYEYTVGPDNARYAVGGEVSIDTTPVAGDPAATVRKMQTVRKAALAPQSPSSQDQRVAQKASAAEAQARQELTEQRNAEAAGAPESSSLTPAQRAYSRTEPVLTPGTLLDATA